MAVDDPWAIDGLALSALEWRRATSGLMVHAGNDVSAVAGVLSGCAVSVASLTATIAAGQLVITPTAGSNGSYLVGMTATDVPLTVRDATYARIDRIIARIYDNAVDGSGQSKAAVEVVTGSPSASPVAPALPAGALELAQLQVPNSAGGAIVVVDRRGRTAAAGGVPWLPDTAARDAALPAPDARQLCVTGTGATQQLWLYSGTAWRQVWMPPGSVALTIVTATPNGSPTAYLGSDGWVQLDGGFTGLGTAIPVRTWTTICTLPVGYRPTKVAYFGTPVASAVAIGAVTLRVQTNGVIEAWYDGPTSGAIAGLGVIRFRA